MKAIFICLLSVGWLTDGGQKDYSGLYGYGDPAAGAKEPAGTLVLVKMDGSTYRFWLDITRGGPGFEKGETDGTFTITHDTAFFDNTFENAVSSCILKFSFTGNSILVSHGGSAADCGFDNGVNAGGTYTRLEKQGQLSNDWLKQQYPAAPKFTILAAKTELYRDENGLVSFQKKQFLDQGGVYLNITETEKTVYTEFIGPGGDFRYGWVRKTAIKIGN